MPKVCDSQQRYCVYRCGDSIDSRFSADLLSQHFEEKISVGDKRPRSRFSFFFSISLPFHLTPRPYQSTTVLTVPAEAKANLSPISLRGPIHPLA